jgi:hypothetical protein
MPDSDSFFWKQSYREALRESDKEKLAKLVYAAEGAMFFRLLELADAPDHNEERNEIEVACADLLAVKIHKLGWPPSKTGEPTL